MQVGVIGSGSIGPDLAYGFLSAIAKGGGSVVLHDIKKEALDAGRERIAKYMEKAVGRGKLSPKDAEAMRAKLTTTTDIKALASCDYVLEAATEDLKIKQKILAEVENVVRDDCLLGFATSGIPRAQIVARAKRPERCFVNHPFFPAWRALPIEVVLSGDAELGRKMLATLKALGKVPIVTADAVCFAADDIFVNYCAEAARMVAEGLATPAQIDKVVDEAVGGGGPFWVMDLTRGNLLNVHCLELMAAAPTGGAWFTPPPIFRTQGNKPWHEGGKPARAAAPAAVAEEIKGRILAVLLARTFFVVDQKICDPSDLNWLTRTALGFSCGLLDLAAKLGADEVRRLTTDYAAKHEGFAVPASIAERSLPKFYRNLTIERDAELAIVRVRRPEVKNALSAETVAELDLAVAALNADAGVRGIVLSSFDGALAGADITELAVLPDVAACEASSATGQRALDRIAASKKPIVAAVDGPVLGGGAELSMACHARVVGPALVLGQPEVNLGIIPGYGGTQRLPRLIGVDKAFDLLRTGRTIGAKEACAWGWASGEPTADMVTAAKALVRRHLAGEIVLQPVAAQPLTLPATLPAVDVGHHSLAIDQILVEVVMKGLRLPLHDGLALETKGFGRCKQTVDMDIGMKNFIQNGPRVAAVFLHE
ncbi:MAG: 3-hydroxyacyl-CoA dehydrogenase/enoyl-CoA hydratase family protein [Deltaproteobacteria bacterium]|nr:3-hydroxyacyl-CoA dehydrogenase/enoyl-CoA hydratase family protein [Deltaproteobacteria bacterium]